MPDKPKGKTIRIDADVHPLVKSAAAIVAIPIGEYASRVLKHFVTGKDEWPAPLPAKGKGKDKK